MASTKTQVIENREVTRTCINQPKKKEGFKDAHFI
jgi:hypothetical protein